MPTIDAAAAAAKKGKPVLYAHRIFKDTGTKIHYLFFAIYKK